MRRYAVLAAAVVILGALALPASAITYGQADDGAHPEVGALTAKARDGSTYAYCSGALISPTVFLTAAHCGDADGERVRVTFEDSVPDAKRFFVGTFHPHPRYPGSSDDAYDIAVVVLDKTVKGVTPAALPASGMLDRMKADGTLNQGTRFTSVGYGGQEVDASHTLTYEDTREFSVGSFSALNGGWLRLSQNQATGDGGTCYGDSGGPNFLGAYDDETNILAGITVTGDVWCQSTNTTYRTDTRSARGFLDDYVRLP